MKRSLAGAVLMVAAAIAASGCIVVSDDDGYYDDSYHDDDGYVDPGLDAEAAIATIDVGAAVGVVEPGRGAGIFVEAAADGRWRVFTTCDTDLSDYACGWEVYLRGEGVTLTGTSELEDDDVLDFETGAIDGYLVTDFDVDVIDFEATPGAIVELTTLLDGVAAHTFIYWVGDGVQNEGAPTDPIAFEPR